MRRRAAPITPKLQNWDTRASVRVKPRRMLLADEEAEGKRYFSPELVPEAAHPLVRGLGESAARELQVRHLYRYLDFTTQLELEVINTVSKDLALGKVDFDLPDVMREDAFKLCTDEAHHACFSDDVKRQVIAATRLAPGPAEVPPFLLRLREIQDGLSPELGRLAELFFAVVSETLISGILCRIPRDEQVVTAVRHIVADHAEDEGRHSAYFSQLFGVLWPRLSGPQRAAIGPLLPRFIVHFLEPDTAAIRRDLARLPLSDADAAAVVEDTFPTGGRFASEARDAATVTLRLFQHNGLLDDPQLADEFRAVGLID